MVQAQDGIPDRVNMKALRGFYAPVNGRFMSVNPGDVVEVDKALAVDLRLAKKAVMVSEAPHMNKDYLPARKRPAGRAASKEG